MLNLIIIIFKKFKTYLSRRSSKQDGRRSNIDSCVSSPWPSARARTRANEGANLELNLECYAPFNIKKKMILSYSAINSSLICIMNFLTLIY